jgi:RND family efflux transporter MFP subunit
MKRWHIALAAILLGSAAAGAWWWLRPAELAVTAPSRGEAVEAVYATGSVEPSVMLPLAPRTSGRLVARLADEGDQVRKGQLLARLDDSDLRSSVDEQLARADFARRQHARLSALAARGFVASGESDRAGAELQAAEAALRRLQAQREFGALYAPADGSIIRRDGEVGQYIGAGQALFVLACCAPLRVTADIDEEDINRVHRGQPVVLRADAVPGKVFDGTVSEITPKGDPVNRSYRVRIALADPGQLRTGMTVDANLIVARRANALLLPTQAIHNNAAWVVDHGRLRLRPLKTGSRGARHTEILAGLRDGDTVVAKPDESLAEGQRVRPLPR